MLKDKLVPDYIFESSWEVCNKVGGIYTVLSTRAKTLQEALPDRIIFIGPLFDDTPTTALNENATLPSWLMAWQQQAAGEGLRVKVGRWAIPGEPLAVLVDFKPYFAQKNELYTLVACLRRL